MNGYSFHMVNGHEWHEALEPLYRKHYREMQDRLAADGIAIGDYNPRLDQYFAAMDSGRILTFVVLCDGDLVGYSNVWLTEDMHNSELIATEDTVYMLPDFRKGAGRMLVKMILDHLRAIGCKRITISPVTDLRVGKIWARMGFRPVAEQMVYNFEEAA